MESSVAGSGQPRYHRSWHRSCAFILVIAWPDLEKRCTLFRDYNQIIFSFNFFKERPELLTREAGEKVIPLFLAFQNSRLMKGKILLLPCLANSYSSSRSSPESSFVATPTLSTMLGIRPSWNKETVVVPSGKVLCDSHLASLSPCSQETRRPTGFLTFLKFYIAYAKGKNKSQIQMLFFNDLKTK